jgi:hypothetical protein
VGLLDLARQGLYQISQGDDDFGRLGPRISIALKLKTDGKGA